MRRATAAALVSVFALAVLPRSVVAQGEDAAQLRPGTLRITLAPDWSRWDHRFGEGTPGYAKGALEPAGIDFSSDSLGIGQLPFLQGVQTRVRNLTGLSAFRLNLGRAQLTLNTSVRVVPLGLELGVTRRLAIGVVVPIVRSRVEAFLLGPDTAGGDSATRGNVGWNPAWVDTTAGAAFRAQVDSVLQALADQVANGPPDLRQDAQDMLDMKEGFDVGLEMSGNPDAFREMLSNMCHGGRIAMLGIPEDSVAIDWQTVVFNMLTIKGIYGRQMYDTWYKMSVMLQSGLDISPVITHRFPFSEFEKGFEVMRTGQSGKVILNWSKV